jgi:hypothetical protein
VKQNDETTTYAHLGMAAMLPGMAHMVSLMQRALDEMREALGQAQGVRGPYKKLGRPRNNIGGVRAEVARSGWPADPEERSKEMKRRQAVAAKNKNHEKAAKRASIAAKKRWDSMSAKQRKARLAAMVAGRSKKRVDKALAAPTVRMAVAS